jgi:hypothetical protein
VAVAFNDGRCGLVGRVRPLRELACAVGFGVLLSGYATLAVSKRSGGGSWRSFSLATDGAQHVGSKEDSLRIA